MNDHRPAFDWLKKHWERRHWEAKKLIDRITAVASDTEGLESRTKASIRAFLQPFLAWCALDAGDPASLRPHPIHHRLGSHLCHNWACYNPSHLTVEDSDANGSRGDQRRAAGSSWLMLLHLLLVSSSARGVFLYGSGLRLRDCNISQSHAIPGS
jgi:hypothetical protein